MRLKNDDWIEIENLIREGKSINSIAKKYNISRNSIYVKSRKNGWLVKKEKTFLQKFINIFKIK